MKVGIFEYITGGGLRQAPIPKSLAHEGMQMLLALLDDLIELPDLSLTVLVDDRFTIELDRIKIIDIGSTDDFQSIWQNMLIENEAIWIIAPETNHVLHKLCTEVEAARKILFNCSSRAVKIATSKLATIQRLEQHQINTVPTIHSMDGAQKNLPKSELYVLKPDDGVGSEGTKIVSDYAEIRSKNLIVQPLLKGDTLSLSVIFNHGLAKILSINRQIMQLSEHGFELSGLEVNIFKDELSFWQSQCDKIALALPELWGYAGIDLILIDQIPMILEINPRLTTSYAGLKKATGINLAEKILSLQQTKKIPECKPLFQEIIQVELSSTLSDYV